MEGECHGAFGECRRILGAVLLPNVGGWISGYSVKNNYGSWYDSLKKPEWQPPKASFGIVWTAMYSGMGYASYLVWRDGGGFSGDAKLPLALYGTQLALNFAWSPIFFGVHCMKGGLIVIGLLTATATATAHMFYNINKTAGYLFIPYIAWLGFASALNYVIWRDNKDKDCKQ